MAGLVEAILKFVHEITFKRVIVLAALISGTVVAILVYERYTSSFTLNRLQRCTDLISSLEALRIEVEYNPDSRLQQAYDSLVDQSVEAIQREPLFSLQAMPTLQHRHITEPVLKFLGGAYLWLFAGLGIYLTGDLNAKGRSGVLMLATLFGLIGLLLPWKPLINFLIYPVGSFAALLSFVSVLALRYARRMP